MANDLADDVCRPPPAKNWFNNGDLSGPSDLDPSQLILADADMGAPGLPPHTSTSTPHIHVHL